MLTRNANLFHESHPFSANRSHGGLQFGIRALAVRCAPELKDCFACFRVETRY